MDFGFSKIVSKQEKLIEGLGTLYYASPELIQNSPYNIEIDIWSIGLLIYFFHMLFDTLRISNTHRFCL